MKNIYRLIHVTFLLLIAVFATILGLGKGYPGLYSPLENYGTFEGIDGDRWIQNNAEINLSNLSSRGNKITLNFHKWHPENLPPAQLQVYVCGNLASQFKALPGGSYDVFLTGECEPRNIKFVGLNPFQAGVDDQRLLIAKLSHLTVSGRFGFVILDNLSILKVVGLIFILLGIISVTFPTFVGFLLSLASAVSSYVLLVNYYFINPNVLLNFYLVISLILLGLLIGKLTCFKVFTERQLVLPKLLTILSISVAVIGGAMLRFFDIDFGLPANYHPDEVPKYNAIERMRFYQDLNPRYFLHPTLLLYSAYFFNSVLRFVTSTELPWMETLILAGRMMSATAGTLSILLTALIARRLFNNYAAVISAFLLAVFPLHVTCSRYLKEDALLVFFILLAVYLVIRSVQEEKPRALILAGLIAGFSASVKYTGLVSVMILVAAPFLKSNSLIPDLKFLRWTVRGIFFLPLGFILASPYTLLDFGTFLKDFNYERSHMASGHDGLITASSQLWTYHFARSLWNGMEPFVLAFGVIGIGYLLYRNKIKYWYIVALFLLYYIPAEFVKAKPAPQPERYVVPCLAFLAIGIGVLLSELFVISKSIISKLTVTCLVIILILIPAKRSWELAEDLKPDTRDLMTEWVVKNVPKGSKILIDLPAYQAPLPSQDYQILPLTRSSILEELDPKLLRQSGANYLLLSSLFYDRYFSQPGIPPHLREIIRNVFNTFPVVKEYEAASGTYGFNNPKVTLFKID